MSKHARAGHVTVRLWKDGRTIRCSIGDDGMGFNSSAVCPRGEKCGFVDTRTR